MMPPSPRVIGLVGEKGSGKGTFAELIERVAAPQRVARIRFSDVLRETLDLWDVPKTREHLQDLAAVMVEQYGPDALSHAIEVRVFRAAAAIVVLDGLRWKADAVLLNRFPHHLLVYVTAPSRARFERLSDRSENVGERGMSYEQFLFEERKITEVDIPTIGAAADIRVENTDTLAALTDRAREVVARCRAANMPKPLHAAA